MSTVVRYYPICFHMKSRFREHFSRFLRYYSWFHPPWTSSWVQCIQRSMWDSVARVAFYMMNIIHNRTSNKIDLASVVWDSPSEPWTINWRNTDSVWPVAWVRVISLRNQAWRVTDACASRRCYSLRRSLLQLQFPFASWVNHKHQRQRAWTRGG